MQKPQFVTGQRYISSTEIELGLGIVSHVEYRRVTITFPAANEKRTYATDSTPLSRIVFDVGDTVTNRNGDRVTITQVNQDSSIVYYTGLCFDSTKIQFNEVELSDQIQFSGPIDRLFSGQIDSNRSYLLRQQTLTFQNRMHASAAAGFFGPRVQLLPHQIYIANEVASRLIPRVLLADEVGLGKTIEAGLILHKLILTGRVHRALILVPESLTHQWLVEMLRGFNLNLTIIDEEQIENSTASTHENPYDDTQLAISSIELIGSDQHAFDCIQQAGWDLLVIDEAHRIHWQADQPSQTYTRIATLSAKIPGLLLLTATPEQLGAESHFARLRLLDPDRFHSFTDYQQQEKQYERIADLIHRLTLHPEADDFQTAQQLLQNGSETKPLTSAAELAHQLLDYYGTGRVFYRNTRDNVAGFPARKLVDHCLLTPDKYRHAQHTDNIEHLLQPEHVLGEEWTAIDPRSAWLSDWLQQHRTEKTLLICANAKTACRLEHYLTLQCGIKSALFHEYMPLVARDRAAAYFSEADGAQILLCSEIGSEGRNFQFCSHLILFDLPLNPDVLEQRIGRLDRIGQMQEISIHVPYYENTAMETLLRWYNEALDSFSRVFPAGYIVFQQISEQLKDVLRSSDTEEIEQFLANSKAHSEAALSLLQRGRNRLTEFHSFHHETADRLIDEIYEFGIEPDLRKYSESLLDYFGYEIEDQDHRNIIIRPGSQMVAQPYSGLPEDGITATFQRDVALTRDDLHFLSWEHPLIQACMQNMLSEHLGSVTLCTMKLKPLPAGSLLIESVFNLLSQAPKHLSLQRFMHPSLLRLLIDENRNELGRIVKMEHLDKLSSPLKSRTAQTVIKSFKDKITAIIHQAEDTARAQQKELIGSAIERINQLYEPEHLRLQSMSQRNPNITPKEIQLLQQNWQDSLQHIRQANLHLDSIRLCIVVE